MHGEGMSRKKILFVAGRPPFPLDTGAKIRSWHILSGFCRDYDVDVLLYQDMAHNSSWIVAAEKLGVKNLVQLKNTMLNCQVSPQMFIRAVLRGLPGTVLKYQTSTMTKMFQDMLMAGDYSLVHIEHVHLSSLFAHVADAHIVCSLDAHNVETQIVRRMIDMESSFIKKMALRIHAANMLRFEKQAFFNADLVFAVSDEDVSTIESMSDKTTSVALVENGVDITYFSPEPKNKGENTVVNTMSHSISMEQSLVFVGSMDWLPNIDGVKWFVNEVLPLIRANKTECRLVVVGRNPHQSISVLDSPENGVFITGTVDDVRPFVRHATVVVVPLRYGGGTRLKILEAFAMSVPVVSTSLGCEGIKYEDSCHLLLADTPNEIAEKCCFLMENRAKADEIAQNARELVLGKYSWEAITGKMLIALDAAIVQKTQV